MRFRKHKRLFGVLTFFLFCGCGKGLQVGLDSKDSLLDFSPRLKSNTSPLSRVFKDSSGTSTQIAIGGVCEAAAGDVTLSGAGLSQSTDLPCHDGIFSAIIFYSSGSPAFTDDLGGKKITIAQKGKASVSTVLFKAAMIHTNVIVVSDAAQLASLPLTPETYAILNNNIDLALEVATTNNWSSLAPTAGGVAFQGVLEGNGFRISNLHNTSGNGLFDLVGGTLASPAVITHLQVMNASVACSVANCGIIAGTTNQYTNLVSVSASGTASGTSSVGGLVGVSNGRIIFSKSNVTATGSVAIGGLAGNTGATSLIDQSYANGNVTATLGSAGGLVGGFMGSMTDSYSKVLVTGASAGRAGGVIGKLSPGGSVARCAAFGEVNAPGSSNSGLAVGVDQQGLAPSAIIYNSAATCTGCTNTLFTGKSPIELQTKATFEAFNWDFTTAPVWKIDEGREYPQLFWE